MDSRILVENGDVFEGSRGQFTDCFFTNADDEEIKDWCFDNGWKLEIDGKTIL